MLVLGAVSSVQFGAALAKSIFDEIGPGGTVFLRVALAAVLLAALWRPGCGASPVTGAPRRPTARRSAEPALVGPSMPS